MVNCGGGNGIVLMELWWCWNCGGGVVVELWWSGIVVVEL